MIKYPAAIDTELELPIVIDNKTHVNSEVINNLRDAVIALESALGINPAGIYSNVRTRIVALEIAVSNITGGGSTTVFGGDLSSATSVTQKVIGIQNRPVSASAPSTNQVYAWNGNEWTPTTISGGSGGGDVPPVEISLVAGIESNGSSIFKRIGARSLDMSIYPATMNGLTRQVDFVADVQKTPAATSVEIQLIDITHNALIAGTNLTSTSNDLFKVSVTDITVGSSNGNIRSDVESYYELQIKMNGGSDIDQVYCTNARLIITYA